MLDKLSRLDRKWMVLLALIITVTADNIYIRSYFRFENFKEGYKTEKYLKKHFPKNTDAKILLETLKNAGAVCFKVKEKAD